MNYKLRTTNYELRTIKIIHTPHGHIFYGYYGKLKSKIFLLIERLTAKITDVLVALTEGEKNESLAFGVGKVAQWTVIHSGVEMVQSSKLSKNPEPRTPNTEHRTPNYELRTMNYELRTTLGIPDDALVVGTVARLEPVKGVKYFIEAIPTVYSLSPIPYPLVFLIVGDGSEKRSLEFRVESLEIKDKVIFTGMRDDVTDLIETMDVYVQPSLNEGMGKTIVQAMLLGKSVIATNVQGIPDLIKDGQTGLLVPPENSDELATAIKKLIDDPALRKKLGDAAKKYVNENIDGLPRFGVERMIYLLEKLYG